MLSRAIMWFFGGLFWLLCAPFVRFHYRGGEHLGDHESWVMTANHRSVFDFPWCVIALTHFRQDSRIMVAGMFWKRWWSRWAVRAVDAIPVYRTSDPRGALSAAVAALEGGDSICIMPEGGIFYDEADPRQLGPYKTGVARLAAGSGRPVLPIAFVGGERFLAHGSARPRTIPFLRRRDVMCMLDDANPIFLSGDDHRANADKVREHMVSLQHTATRELQAIDPTYRPDLT